LVWLPDELRAQLDATAAQRNQNLSEVTTALLSAALSGPATTPTPALPPVDTSPLFDVADDSAQRGPANERLARIRALKREQPQLSAYAIAAQLGCDETTVWRALKKLNQEATE